MERFAQIVGIAQMRGAKFNCLISCKETCRETFIYIKIWCMIKITFESEGK